MGFSKKVFNFMYECISTILFSLLINGSSLGNLYPQQGLRQGDTLSLYPFLIVSKYLSQFISKAKRSTQVHRIYVVQGALPIYYLMYAYDIVLFRKENISESHVIKDILNNQYNWSEQCINLQKSTIFLQEYLTELSKSYNY